MSVQNDKVTSEKPWLDAELTKIELSRLLGKSVGAVDYWARAKGLPQTPNGTFNLRQALHWIEQHYRAAKTRTVGGTGLTEQDLTGLFGVTRQAVFKWRKRGLPRAASGYSLREVCAWLRGFYRRQAEAEYQRRLRTMRKKLRRNLAQCERFISRSQVE